ncbi:MAG: DNA-directed DNA polymerase [Candidatus Nanoarchaeia archaeon]|jgi:DNA polymerase elongation subunit (family B)|nr:DNA-directed DNA polymerase [Candidatus Nanoarchaeia archaeon]|tara:strand:+ start:28261 stop:30705 length:2445 start_codon:yes stop_codon:yes gene_type:complete
MVKTVFFPLDLDYKDDDELVIRIFGKTLDDKKICVLDYDFKPYFWIIPKKNANLTSLTKKIKKEKEEDLVVLYTKLENKKYFGKEIEAIKVVVNKPKFVPILRSLIRDYKEVDSVNENDILFVRRYLIDKNISPLNAYEVEGDLIETNLDVDFSLKLKSIKQGEGSFDNPKILSFDIETYTHGDQYSKDNKDPIISLALVGDNFKKVVTWKRIPTEKDIIFVKGEKDLIDEFVKTIKKYKPDFLVGYFSDGFDFPYLRARAKKYDIDFDINLDGTNIKLSKKNFGSVKTVGIVHIDIYKFIRGIMSVSLQLDSYGLGEVAKALIKEEKMEIDISKLALVWDSGSKEIEDICEYNLHDADLTYKICKEVLLNIFELCRLLGQTPHDVCRTGYGQLIESYLLRKAKDFNEIAPNKPSGSMIGRRRLDSYQGAFVFQPKPGLYDDLVVFDFKSLYPSVIVSHNIDPSSLTKSKKDSYKTPDIFEGDKKVNYYFSHKEEALVPYVIKELILRRNRIREILKENKDDKILDARSKALKIAANAAYGMFGFFGARWYSKECAAAITAYGRDYIKNVIEKSEKEGFNVIYSDTDSIVIVLDKKSKEDVLIFMNKINRELPSLMEIELEDFYKKGIFVTKKGESSGAKKKYALISQDNSMKIRGFETVRRDWSYLAKNTQMKVLEIILKENSIEKAFEYAKKVIDDVRKKKIPIKDMVIRTQLKKDISDYENIGPHVKVAERMKNKGMSISIGTMINYVVVKGDGLIRDRSRLLEECEEDDYDSGYYINHQIVPSLKMIFEACGLKEEDLLMDKEQKTLGEF